MTPSLLAAATGCTAATANKFAGPLTAAMARWGVDSAARQAHFLAQCAHESARFERLEEGLSYSPERLMAVWPTRFKSAAAAQPYARNPQALANLVYAGRMGNREPGDGWRYHGRGCIQLTGRAAYEAYEAASGKPVAAFPELLLDPAVAADSAAWFWSKNSCNTLADAGDVRGLTRRINGGQNGLQERLALTARALAALGCV